ncbi:MAG: hypothetical protein ACRC4T_08500 [Cetobacterium sp.]
MRKREKFNESYDKNLYPKMFIRWNEDEKNYLISTEKRADEIAKDLGRTIHSIKRMANRLKINLKK